MSQTDKLLKELISEVQCLRSEINKQQSFRYATTIQETKQRTREVINKIGQELRK